MLLPLTFNDGTAVPRPTLDSIFDELFVSYGGYTIAGEVEGAYRMSSGGKQVDTCLEVWIAVEAGDLASLRRQVARFGKLLGQETMYFERTGAAVDFVPAEGDDPQEGGSGDG